MTTLNFRPFAFLVLALALTAGATTDAAAEGRTGPYIGGTLGISWFDADDFENLDLSAGRGSNVNFDVDDQDLAGGAFVGWQVLDYLAFEVGYLYLGAIEADGTFGFGTRGPEGFVERFEVEAEAWGINFAARGNYPLPILNEALSIVGSVGGLYYEVDVDGRSEGFDRGFPTSTSTSDDGVAFTLSGGLQADILDAVAIRAEYQRIFDVEVESSSILGPSSPDAEFDVDQFLVSVIWRLNSVLGG